MNLPVLCTELRIRADGRVPIVNSRDVAEFFKKRHDHVLRDIAALNISPDLGRSWFRPAPFADSYGRDQPTIDMTRDGFTLLVMGWTGERAMAFKIKYIEAFNAMEVALNDRTSVTGTELIQAVREIVAPLAVRFDGNDKAIERIERRQESQAEDIADIKIQLAGKRKEISDDVKRDHMDAITQIYGGRCPCGCGRLIVISGIRVVRSNYDHFYQPHMRDAAHTWLICKETHDDLTYGRVARVKFDGPFRGYQQSRMRLPGRQPELF